MFHNACELPLKWILIIENGKFYHCALEPCQDEILGS